MESILEDMRVHYASLEPKLALVSHPSLLDWISNLFVETEAILCFDMWRSNALHPLVTPTKIDQPEISSGAKNLNPSSQTRS